MNFKKVAAFACAATVAASAAGLAGCGFFGKGRPKTVTENGFSVKLSTKYKKVSLSDDDIVRGNTIMCYDSDDIMFTVAQIPRDDIYYYHVYDLSTFTTFIVEDYYESKEEVYEFKSEDGSLDGNTLAMYYTNTQGYKNVQADYLFAGTKYFYEVSLVTLRDDYSGLKDDIESIVLSCQAEDGLNESADVKLKDVECGKLKFKLNEAFEYDKEESCYTNGLVFCDAYCVDDAKFLTLDGLLNFYRFEFEDYESEAAEAKTVNGTKFIYLEGTEKGTGNSYDWRYAFALYIDSDGAGYIVEFDLPEYDFTDRYLADAKAFMNSASGGIDDYKTGLTAGEKTFKDNAQEQGYGYSLTLDDTYFDYGWSDATEDFMLYSAEHDRYIYICESSASTVDEAFAEWKGQATGKDNRVKSNKKYEGMTVGATYQLNYAKWHYYEIVLFVQVDNRVFIVTYGVQTGFFDKVPVVDTFEQLDACDRLFLNALAEDGECKVITVE